MRYTQSSKVLWFQIAKAKMSKPVVIEESQDPVLKAKLREVETEIASLTVPQREALQAASRAKWDKVSQMFKYGKDAADLRRKEGLL